MKKRNSIEEMQGFSRLLDCYLTKHGLRPVDLAKESGIKPHNVSELRSGRRAPSRENVIILGKVFGRQFIREAYKVLYPEIA